MSMYYSDAYDAAYPARIQEKLNRKWTQSPQVEKIFEVVEKLYHLEPDDGERSSKHMYSDWHEGELIGYLNPRESRSTRPVGYKAHGATEQKICWEGRPWDVRFACANNVKTAETTDLSQAVLDEGILTSMTDTPACYTDYGNTIFIIDNPAILDILVASGNYKMPKCAKNEVFLALSPAFVEANPEISALVDEAKEKGEVFDIRDWYESGLVELVHNKYFDTTVWHGEIPDEIVEPILARRMSGIVSEVRGSIIRGFEVEKYPRIADAKSCLNVANGLAMNRDFLDFPSITGGKRISTNSKWTKFEAQSDIEMDMEGGKYSEKMQKVSDKLDMLEDIVQFWERAHLDWRFSVLLDEPELADTEFVFEKLYALGQAIGADNYIETYNAGVPAEDILA